MELTNSTEILRNLARFGRFGTRGAKISEEFVRDWGTGFGAGAVSGAAGQPPSQDQWLSGQLITNARPTTWETGTNPLPGVSVCSRLSAEL